ncbi:ABC transporter substrate-binding protein [soil metagenome]
MTLFAAAAAAALAAGGVAAATTVPPDSSPPADTSAGTTTPAGTEAPADTTAPAGTEAPVGSDAPAGTATATPEGSGGVVYYGDAQEFSSLNNNAADTNSVKNGIITTIVLPDAFPFAGPDGYPQMDTELLDSAELISEDPQVVEYVINADANWSDGEPIDCDDFYLLWIANNETVQQRDESGEPLVDDAGTPDDPADDIPLWLFQPAGTNGYFQIDSIDCSEDGKTLTMSFDAPYADWNTNFQDIVPAHVVEREAGVDDLIAAYEADDFDALSALADAYLTIFTPEPGVIDPAIMVSGDSMMLDSWEAGSSITLVRNPDYWGTPASVDSLTIRYIAEEAQAQALANGDIDVMDPQPSPDLLANLESLDGVTVQPGSSFIWEHFDFNFRNPVLRSFDVRQAFAYCLPRQAMVTNLIEPVAPGAEILNNRWIQDFEPAYQDNSGGGYQEVDLEQAQALLEGSGEELPITIRLGWFDNGQNQRRANQVALVTESCNQVGFDVVDAGSEIFFDSELDAGETWDVAMFAWAGSPVKSGAVGIYDTGGGNNNGQYSNPEVDDLVAQLAASLDNDEILDLANQIDTILWQDLATIPVFSFPAVSAWNDNVENVVFNPSQNGIMWNADTWRLTAA